MLDEVTSDTATVLGGTDGAEVNEDDVVQNYMKTPVCEKGSPASLVAIIRISVSFGPFS